MTTTREALLLGSALILVALLAVFEIVPEQVAQFAPVAAVSFLLRRRSCVSGAC